MAVFPKLQSSHKLWEKGEQNRIQGAPESEDPIGSLRRTTWPANFCCIELCNHLCPSSEGSTFARGKAIQPSIPPPTTDMVAIRCGHLFLGMQGKGVLSSSEPCEVPCEAQTTATILLP